MKMIPELDAVFFNSMIFDSAIRFGHFLLTKNFIRLKNPLLKSNEIVSGSNIGSIEVVGCTKTKTERLERPAQI